MFCQSPDGGPRSFVTSIHLFTDVGEDRVFRVLYDNICYFVVMLGGPLVLLAFLAAGGRLDNEDTTPSLSRLRHLLIPPPPSFFPGHQFPAHDRETTT